MPQPASPETQQTESAPTPGPSSPAPWTYEVHQLSEGYSAIVYDATGHGFGCDHLYEADARLIAAAPDLLAACKEFVRKVDAGEARSTASYEQMRAAIAKAEGRS